MNIRTLALSLLLSAPLLAQETTPEKLRASRCHVYIDYENIWTLEMNVDGRQPIPILNIITFGDDENPLRPDQIHIFNQRGKQASVEKLSIDTGVSGDPYVTDFLQVLQSSFIGMDLEGDFGDHTEPTQVSVELGDVEFTLEPIDCLDFESLAQQIDQVNFNSPDLTQDFEVLRIPLLGSKGEIKKGRR